MKLFKWLPGRQATTTYFKLCFLYFKWSNYGFDGHILKYPADIYLPPHKDPVDGKHYRLNIKLKGKCYFWCTREIVKIGEFLHIFRPDAFPHSLHTFTPTIKISLGMVKFNK